MSVKTLYLLDGHSLVYRAYHAIGPLSNAAGEPTGAIFGFMQILQRLLKDHGPDHIVVVFDPKGPTFRSAMLAEYKANRPEQPPELTSQISLLKELLSAMNLRCVEMESFEADDVIASLAVWAVENDGEAVVVSVDKDLLQVVRPGIKVLRDHLGRVEVLDDDGVVGKLGVRPGQVPAYLGLVGDTADNIPGVPGIGAKTAAKLLTEFGDLESIIAAAPGKIAEKPKKPPKIWVSMEENADLARKSTELATIRTDALPENAAWDTWSWEGLKPSADLVPLLQRLEFRSLLEEIGGLTVAERETDYETILSEAKLKKACESIKATGHASIDTETTDLDPFRADLVGISLSWKTNQAVYIPVKLGDEGLPLQTIREHLSPLLSLESISWTAHNWVFDYRILKAAGFEVRDIEFDTMLASYVTNPDGNAHGLKALSLTQLGIRMTEFKEVAGGGGDMFSIASADLDAVSEYACQDADVTLQLREKFHRAIDERGVSEVFAEIEMPLVAVIARMETEGVRVDRKYLENLAKEVRQRLEKLTAEIHELAGRPFNINSPKQLAEILFVELKLPTGKKTSTGYSTDVTVLEELSGKHPLPAKLLEYRQLDKLRGTYIEALPSLINPVTGRLHTSFNQTIAATGRLSSSDPNLQNIPVRTEDGRRIRQGFIPRKGGWKLLSADYSQIELRILAHISGDRNLKEAFESGSDIHTRTAALVFGLDESDVTREQRGQAKAVNFGIIYGMTAFRLSRDFGISRGQAEDFISDYFAAYPGVRDYIEGTLRFCFENGYVETLRGRRRWLAEVRSQISRRRKNAEKKGRDFEWFPQSQPERMAINTPIQGTSADMIKLAMIRIDRRLLAEGLRSRMILQVHDELIFDCPEDELEAVAHLATGEMKAAVPLDVPIVVDVETGENWARI